MAGKRSVGISQCMIVKNEEKNIERALSWGRGIVSEQIVVDTGSSDRTVEIAAKMGAKVYHYAWEGDFSAAKNYAISKAKYEWIAFLDADEYFSKEDAEKVLYYVNELQDKKYDIIVTGLANLDQSGNVISLVTQERIFRNIPGLRYNRRIHEYLASVDGTKFYSVDATGELTIYHTGYGNAQVKIGRNLELIQAELAEHPDDWEMLGYLGDLYYAGGDLESAEKAFRSSVSLISTGKDDQNNVMPRIATTFVKLLEILYIKQDTEKAAFMDVYDKAVNCLPEDADPDYYAGAFFVKQGDYRLAEKHLRKALSLLGQYGYNCKSMAISAHIEKAYELLALCCCNNGNMEECVQWCTALLSKDRYLMDTLFLLLVAFSRDGLKDAGREVWADTVIGFLGKNLYDFSALKDRYFVLKAAKKTGEESLIQGIRKLFTIEELAMVDQR